MNVFNVIYARTNELMNEVQKVCYLYWVRPTFLLKRYDVMINALPNDQPTNQPTNQLMDTAYDRDARTHLKTTDLEKLFFWSIAAQSVFRCVLASLQ